MARLTYQSSILLTYLLRWNRKYVFTSFLASSRVALPLYAVKSGNFGEIRPFYDSSFGHSSEESIQTTPLFLFIPHSLDIRECRKVIGTKSYNRLLFFRLFLPKNCAISQSEYCNNSHIFRITPSNSMKLFCKLGLSVWKSFHWDRTRCHLIFEVKFGVFCNNRMLCNCVLHSPISRNWDKQPPNFFAEISLCFILLHNYYAHFEILQKKWSGAFHQA